MAKTTPRTIHNGMDIIDSRDVIARIEYLEGDLRGQYDDLDSDELPITNGERIDFESWLGFEDQEGNEDAHELIALRALQNEAERCGDWTYGVLDSYFEDYARKYAEDIGAIQRDAQWPNNHIDWAAAAEALQQDFTSVSFDGETYWVCS